MNAKHLTGAGLDFRRELIPEFKSAVAAAISFFEIAPENWIDTGGLPGRELRSFTERYPFVCHGLSLSIGSPLPLDEGHLYDLLPIPFTGDAVKYVAARIRRSRISWNAVSP